MRPPTTQPDTRAATRVVLIGAGGIFGSRIARQLADDPRFHLTLCGRRRAPLESLRRDLPGAAVSIATLDTQAPAFAARLAEQAPQLVIHAAGPFQGRDYRVAKACIECASHYLDLADGRGFVCGIDCLHARAVERDVLLVSGASTLPAVSGAIVDALAPRFARLERIQHAISPGNRTPRGDATVASILSYCGRPVPLWRAGRWQHGYGWMHSRKHRFLFGPRWTGLCDVPDLQLFPHRYAGVQDVVFRAGLELRSLHAATWALAALVRMRLVRDPARQAHRLRRISECVAGLGSDVGGMMVELTGTGQDGRSLVLRHGLEAGSGDGPFIPTTPAVVLAHKLAAGCLVQRGAMPCLGLCSLDEIEAVWRDFDIHTRVDELSR